LGAFVLAYSRQMLDDIVNCIYGENRFRKEGIKQQIYYGDTDSIIIHVSLLDKLIKAGFIGNTNGLLADDLNKQFLENGFAKIIMLCAGAPKKYAVKYVMPDDKIKSKLKCNGINQNNMKFKNPFNEDEILTELNYEIFEEFYLNSIDHTLNKHERKFIMPDRLTRINFKKTQQQKLNKVPMFSIHSSTMERVIFNEVWSGRKMFEFPYSIPLNSAY